MTGVMEEGLCGAKWNHDVCVLTMLTFSKSRNLFFRVSFLVIEFSQSHFLVSTNIRSFEILRHDFSCIHFSRVRFLAIQISRIPF